MHRDAMQRDRIRDLVRAASLVGMLSLVGSATAATKYWDTDPASGLQGGDGTWDTGSTAKWSSSTAGSSPLVAWDAGDTADFRTAGILTNALALSGTVEAHGITKGNNNRVTLSGGTLKLGAGGLVNDEAGETKALVVESPVVLTANQEWRVKWSSPSIVRVSGDIGEDAPGRELTLARSAGGAGGRFELSGTSTYSGGTVLNGTNVEVWVSSADALGTGAITLDGSILMNKAALALANDIVVGPNAPVANPGSLDFSVGDLTFSGDVSGAGTVLVKNVTNTKTLTLSGDNGAFSGTWSALKGKLRFAGQTAGSADATWNIGDAGAVLDFGGGTLHAGALNSLTAWAKVVTAGSGNYTLVVGEKNADCAFAAEIVGSNLDIVKRGAAIFTVSHANNDFRKGVTVEAGVLAFATLTDNWGGNSSLGPTGPIVLDGGTLRYIGTGHSSNRGLTLGLQGGTLDASGTGAIAFTSATLTLPTGGARTLTLAGTSTAANTLAAKLTDDGANPTAVSKTGGGIWALTSTAHTFTGPTTVHDGALWINGSLPATTAVGVADGGALGGNGVVNGAVSVAAGGRLAPGGPVGSLVAQNVAFTNGATFAVDIAGTSFTFDGTEQYDRLKIPATGSLSLDGATLALDLGSYHPSASGLLFGILQNETSLPIDGTFADLPEGATVLTDGDLELRVTYTGHVSDTTVAGRGTGNDIVLFSAPRRIGTIVLVR